MKKFKIAIVALLVCMSVNVQAQEMEKGLKDIVETGVFIPTAKGVSAMFSLSAVAGYQFNKNFFAGLGVGLFASEDAIIPITADLRYFIPLEGKWTPYVNVKGGAGFDVSQNKTDYMVGVRGGVRYALNDHNGLLGSFGWERWGPSNMLAITVGIDF